MPTDPIRIAARVGAILESIGLLYSIGGSLASSFSGEPRASFDVDIVVLMESRHIPALKAALDDEFYVDEGALERAVRKCSSANIIHQLSSLKIDLFIAGGTPLDGDLLQRRQRVEIDAEPHARVYVHTPEDILLQKLRWYRLGGEVSDRQWRDVLGIIRVQQSRLDQNYLTSGAERLNVADLLGRAFAQIRPLA